MVLRALLIGIDDYPVRPLRGCVNDIDLIESYLLGPLGASAGDVLRLTAPRAGTVSASRLPAGLPTLANIRGTLRILTAATGREDRVLIYYSGHGTQLASPAGSGLHILREAIVPLDFDGGQRLLFDFELNAALVELCGRSSDVTVVLDCCHSAGVARSSALHGDVRTIVLAEATVPPGPEYSSLSSAAARPCCQVIAACLADELAREVETISANRTRFGAFTLAFESALRSSAADISTLTWAAVWPELTRELAELNRDQHPRLLGEASRRVFGGPWAPRDAGIAIEGRGDEYVVRAGTRMGITPGAELGVYGLVPDEFAPLNSSLDEQQRIGVVQVVSADSEQAIARASAPPAPTVIPAGARGRLIRPGEPELLKVRLSPHRRALDEELSKSKLLRVVRDGQEAADVQLVRSETGALFLADDASRADDPIGTALVEISNGDIELARRVLDHYWQYSAPLRLARRSRSAPSKLAVTLLRDDGLRPPGFDPQRPQLEAYARDAAGELELDSKEAFCVQVDNLGGTSFFVTLLRCESNGRVVLLADQVQVAAQGRHIFWSQGELGTPFTAPPDSRLDRLVTVGTAHRDADLHAFLLDEKFPSDLRSSRGSVGARPSHVEQAAGEISNLRWR